MLLVNPSTEAVTLTHTYNDYHNDDEEDTGYWDDDNNCADDDHILLPCGCKTF